MPEYVNPRPSWRRYALDLARVAASRSADPYLQVGAVVLRPDHSIASIGYNGPPAGVELDHVGMTRDSRRPFMIHAEVNALRYATPAEVRGGLLAVTGMPCPSCLTSVAAYGIAEVVFSDLLENYPPDDSYAVAARCGIDLVGPLF